MNLCIEPLYSRKKTCFSKKKENTWDKFSKKFALNGSQNMGLKLCSSFYSFTQVTKYFHISYPVYEHHNHKKFLKSHSQILLSTHPFKKD